MKKQLTIIEDEKDILESLQFLLGGYGYDVKGYTNGNSFLSQHDLNQEGIYLIDWNLPGIPGIDIVKTIRNRDRFSPIFMMSANNKDEQVIEGLKTGADDYIRKPFNCEELVLRLNNAQFKNEGLEQKRLDLGIKLIPESATVIKDGKVVSLTEREFLIFQHLFLNPEKTVTREELLEQFSTDLKMCLRNIDVHVFSLRRKIEKADLGIETAWGKGYKIQCNA